MKSPVAIYADQFDNQIYTAVKAFIMKFVIEPYYEDYGQERITAAYQNYSAPEGDNDFVIMNSFATEQPIIINKSVTKRNDLGFLEIHTAIRTDFAMIISFYGGLAFSISTKFQNSLNSGFVVNDWFLRNYGLVKVGKAKAVNNSDVLDQKAYADRYDVLFTLQGVEEVMTPIPKIVKIDIRDFPIL